MLDPHSEHHHGQNPRQACGLMAYVDSKIGGASLALLAIAFVCALQANDTAQAI
jgi:hypothetical protein